LRDRDRDDHRRQAGADSEIKAIANKIAGIAISPSMNRITSPSSHRK